MCVYNHSQGGRKNSGREGEAKDQSRQSLTPIPPDPSPPHCSALRFPESSPPKGQIPKTKAEPESWSRRQAGETGEVRGGVGVGVGRDRRWETIWLGKRRGGQQDQRRKGRAGLPGPTGSSDGRGCPGHLWPLLLGFLPLPLLLLLLLLDETEVGAAELSSGGRRDQPRLQQHGGQAEEQGARDAPAEPRHGREPEGRSGILRRRSGRRRRAPGLRALARSLGPPRSVCLAHPHQEEEAGAAEETPRKEEGEVSILAHVTRGAGWGEPRARRRVSAITPGSAAPDARARRGAGAQCWWWLPRVNEKGEPFGGLVDLQIL